MTEKLIYIARAALVVLCVAFIFALAACGGGGTAVSGAMTGETARKAVYTASGTAVALGNLATKYGALPPCPGPVPCKDAAIARKVYESYRDVSTALDGAEKFLAANPQGDATAAVYSVNVAIGTFQKIVEDNNLQYLAGAK